MDEEEIAGLSRPDSSTSLFIPLHAEMRCLPILKHRNLLRSTLLLSFSCSQSTHCRPQGRLWGAHKVSNHGNEGSGDGQVYPGAQEGARAPGAAAEQGGGG